MFRINPMKTSREDKFVPINKARASVRTNPITVSQPHVIPKKDVNSNSNGSSSIGVDNTAKTRRPQPRSNTKNDRVPSASKSRCIKNKQVEVEEHHRNLMLSKNKKHMSSECNNVKLAIRNDNSEFVCAMCYPNLFMKFLGTVRFGNDHVVAILGYGDLQWGNILITRVLFVEGLGHNLFSVGQFCDSDLEVAFRRNTCFVRNLKGVDLLKGNRTTNLYTINLHEMAFCHHHYASIARATSTKSWLWHQRLSHLNFDTINDLARNDLVTGLPKSKDEAPEVIKTFLKKIQVLLQAPVIIVRTDNDTEFKNQVLQEYFNNVGISHQTSSVRTPQQNGQFLLRATLKTALSFTVDLTKLHTSLLMAENRISSLFSLFLSNNMAQFLFHFTKPPDHCSKGESILTYSANSCAYRDYNRQTKKIMETMNVTFDELLVMPFEQSSSKPGLQGMTSGQISSGLDLTYAPSIITTQKLTEHELDLLFEAMHDDYLSRQPSAATRTASAAPTPQVLQTLTASMTIADTRPTPTNSSSQATNIPITSQDVDELKTQHQHVQQQDNEASLQPATIANNVTNAMLDGHLFVNPFSTPSTSTAESSFSQYVDPSNMHTFYQPYPHE
ncbi:retrovirus-related pol polyprotein from transposon TNT 1-94 [Tanacetum coccineum]